MCLKRFGELCLLGLKSDFFFSYWINRKPISQERSLEYGNWNIRKPLHGQGFATNLAGRGTYSPAAQWLVRVHFFLRKNTPFTLGLSQPNHSNPPAFGPSQKPTSTANTEIETAAKNWHRFFREATLTIIQIIHLHLTWCRTSVLVQDIYLCGLRFNFLMQFSTAKLGLPTLLPIICSLLSPNIFCTQNPSLVPIRSCLRWSKFSLLQIYSFVLIWLGIPRVSGEADGPSGFCPGIE